MTVYKQTQKIIHKMHDENEKDYQLRVRKLMGIFEDVDVYSNDAAVENSNEIKWETSSDVRNLSISELYFG